MAGFKMDDYVDVAERISSFYDRFPDGRLVTGKKPHVVEIGGKPYIWYHARAYRTPDDPFPGDGWAAEPVPGPTQFTKDSELMNAETAAWGRAIVALGFSTKKIASRQEVQNRQGTQPVRAASPRPAQTTGEVRADAPSPEPPAAATAPSPVASDAEAWWDRHSLADLNKKIAEMDAGQAREGLILESGREMRRKGRPRKTVMEALRDRIRHVEPDPEGSDGEPEAAPTVSQATTDGAAAPSDSEPGSPSVSPVVLVKAALAWIADQPQEAGGPEAAKAWTIDGIRLGLLQIDREDELRGRYHGDYATLEEVPAETLLWIFDEAIPDPVRDGVKRLGPEALAKLAEQAK